MSENDKRLLPLSAMSISKLVAVFTDVDGTLTSDGVLLPSTYAAICKLVAAGIDVIPVTGRTAGFADTLTRLWPIRAIVAENGGLSFVRPARAGASWRKSYARPLKKLAEDRRVLSAGVRAAIAKVPGARLSSDSLYTEVDLAIDYNEEVKLGVPAAEKIEQILAARGLSAVRSSVHVNTWVGKFDKWTACKKLLRELYSAATLDQFVYVGDSVNDAPLFRAFVHSVGVANVRDVLDRLPHYPRYITRRPEGRGFEEVAARLLSSSRRRA